MEPEIIELAEKICNAHNLDYIVQLSLESVLDSALKNAKDKEHKEQIIKDFDDFIWHFIECRKRQGLNEKFD